MLCQDVVNFYPLLARTQFLIFVFVFQRVWVHNVDEHGYLLHLHFLHIWAVFYVDLSTRLSSELHDYFYYILVRIVS